MTIESAVRLIHDVPNGWVHVEQVAKTPTVLSLYLAIRDGKRGRKFGWGRVANRSLRSRLCLAMIGDQAVTEPRP